MMTEKYEFLKHEFQCRFAWFASKLTHIHNEIELIYMKEGSIRIYHRSKIYTVSEGEFVIIFPNEIHFIEKIDVPKDHKNPIFLFNMSELPDFEDIFSKKRIVGAPIVKINKLNKEVLYCINEIINREDLRGPYIHTKGYLQIILYNILKEFEFEDSPEKNQEDFMGEILNYINKHYKEDITRDALANKFCINKSHLSRKFNSYIGISISDYINAVRVEKAVQMLRNTSESITQIAYECGFDSLSTFFRVFKKNIGVTAKEYRQDL